MTVDDIGDAVFGIETRHCYVPWSKPLADITSAWTQNRDEDRTHRWLPVPYVGAR